MEPTVDADGKPVTTQTDRRRPGGLADRDQAARHQRRRVLQRQLGPPAGEPHAALELAASAGDPADPGRAVLHVRRDGRRPPAGVGGPGRHVVDLRRLLALAVAVGASTGQSRHSTAARASIRSAAATWRARRPASASPNSALWAAATTAASNGSVNSMHDSYTPLGGLVPMWLMQLGEVDLRRRRLGLYGMLVFAIVAVFIAGLMVGRTPEYLGKKIEAFEMKMASLVILLPCAMVLLGTAVAGRLAAGGERGVLNPGPHGFSEVLYAFSSARNNNGSAFAGLRPTTRSTTGCSAWRCSSGGSADDPGAGDRRLAGRQEARPGRAGHAADPHAAVRRAAGGRGRGRRALSFFPALALGPIVEHLMMAVLTERADHP